MKSELGIQGLLVMYVGNLEPYQGIDLLLDSFVLVWERTNVADLVIIGGQISDIRRYEKKCRNLGIPKSVHFLGPKPLADLAGYLSQADILVSPRIKGNNTPMKIYSYLHSGKPVLATNLPTHTQVLDSRAAMLTRPVPEEFSKAMHRLIQDKTLRDHLGAVGKHLVEENYTYRVFREKFRNLFEWLESELAGGDRLVHGVSTLSSKGTD